MIPGAPPKHRLPTNFSLPKLYFKCATRNGQFLSIWTWNTVGYCLPVLIPNLHPVSSFHPFKEVFMKSSVVVALFLVAAVQIGFSQSSNKKVADEIIAIVKAQWAAQSQLNLPESIKNVSEDYTEFNPDYSTRLDGKAINTRLMEAMFGDGGRDLASEMANEKVQVYGDVAVLSYNYVGVRKDKDGKVEPTKAKSTRVYVKQGGKWMLVHANFGADPTSR
jgi:ketosteroid isomerase-like protein